MAPPSDSAFAIHKVKGNRKSRVQEEKKKKKWSEVFGFWDDKLATRAAADTDKPPLDDASKVPSTELAEKVFGLPELLGKVLKYVPSANLLTSKQLVNSAWKNTIERTPAIKRKLWQKTIDPTVAQPHGTTQWDASQWTDASHGEIRALTSGIPIYHGTFAVNMLAPPTNSMRKITDKNQAALAERFPPPPPAPVCPIKAFRGLIRDNFPSLSFTSRPPVTFRLIKPLELQTSIEPTPSGPLINIGFKLLRSLCRGYTVSSRPSGKKSPVEQPPCLAMQLTDPPVSVVWVSLVMSTFHPHFLSSRARINCSLRIPSGVTFADVRDAVSKLTIADARTMVQVEGAVYEVRVSFIADGMTVDGEVVQSMTKWVPTV
ncbi:hypothetical protein Q7P36_008272 [Cladosporium allicinum]